MDRFRPVCTRRPGCRSRRHVDRPRRCRRRSSCFGPEPPFSTCVRPGCCRVPGGRFPGIASGPSIGDGRSRRPGPAGFSAGRLTTRHRVSSGYYRGSAETFPAAGRTGRRRRRTNADRWNRSARAVSADDLGFVSTIVQTLCSTSGCDYRTPRKRKKMHLEERLPSN